MGQSKKSAGVAVGLGDGVGLGEGVLVGDGVGDGLGEGVTCPVFRAPARMRSKLAKSSDVAPLLVSVIVFVPECSRDKSIGIANVFHS